MSVRHKLSFPASERSCETRSICFVGSPLLFSRVRFGLVSSGSETWTIQLRVGRFFENSVFAIIYRVRATTKTPLRPRVGFCSTHRVRRVAAAKQTRLITVRIFRRGRRSPWTELRDNYFLAARFTFSIHTIGRRNRPGYRVRND